MKYRGLFNFCVNYLNNDFLLKNRKEYSLLKNSFQKKFFYFLLSFLIIAISTSASISLPKATLTKPLVSSPFFGVVMSTLQLAILLLQMVLGLVQVQLVILVYLLQMGLLQLILVLLN